MKKFIKFGIALVTLLPMVAFAADAFSILTVSNKLLATIINVLMTLAVVFFIYNVIQYTIAGDDEKKKKARGGIIQGLIGLFVIVAFWGIVRLITTTFGVGPEQINPGVIPCIPGPGVIC